MGVDVIRPFHYRPACTSSSSWSVSPGHAHALSHTRDHAQTESHDTKVLANTRRTVIMGRLRGSDEGLRHYDARHVHLPNAQPRLSLRNFFCVSALVLPPRGSHARTNGDGDAHLEELLAGRGRGRQQVRRDELLLLLLLGLLMWAFKVRDRSRQRQTRSLDSQRTHGWVER